MKWGMEKLLPSDHPYRYSRPTIGPVPTPTITQTVTSTLTTTPTITPTLLSVTGTNF